MTQICETTSAPLKKGIAPQGRVLKGQYVGAFRSHKGKLKGLLLKSGGEEHAIKLPKYLRPILVRELLPEEFIQVWAYPDKETWQAINILPLPEAERLMLQQENESTRPLEPSSHQPDRPSPQRAEVCIQVCRKGKCYKQGSREIWQTLQAEVEANPNLQHVSIEATGCMKACKKGPNLRILPSGKMMNSVSSGKALTVLSDYQ